MVFGDIGTSPLYSLQTVFSLEHNTVAATRQDVLGEVSMVLWTITLIVSVKYTFLVMRADNDGEGGILALVHLLREKLTSRRMLALTLGMGMVGAALFYGDSVITPAISVMSAIEGLTVINPTLGELVLPVSVAIITALFVLQRWGTEAVGRLFGPVMLAWFGVLAALGLPWILRRPDILAAISPLPALEFALDRPWIAFVALGAVVLTITGAEALYADMGHFGAGPIRRAWFALVFPALAINYLGQGALILSDPATVDNPFFHMAPLGTTLPLVALATAATVIASQAVISGAYSVSRQATRLGLLPRLAVKHTSKEEGGQIYIGSINWILYAGILVLIAAFGSSAALASAYGLAVTGTLLLTTLLFLVLARNVWHVAAWRIAVAVVLICLLEGVFLAANLTKVLHGGWIPLVLAVAVITVMQTWRRGIAEVKADRSRIELPLAEFLDAVRARHPRRIPGVAVFPHPDATSTPLALRQLVDFADGLHEHIVIVSIRNENVPHIRHVERARVTHLGDPEDGVLHIDYRVGFNDSQDVPKALLWAQNKALDVDLDPEDARYFLSSLRVTRQDVASLRTWRKALFLWLYRSSANRTQVFHLPEERTVVLGAQLAL